MDTYTLALAESILKQIKDPDCQGYSLVYEKGQRFYEKRSLERILENVVNNSSF